MCCLDEFSRTSFPQCLAKRAMRRSMQMSLRNSSVRSPLTSSAPLECRNPQGVAAGCIRIAVENMANAIKKISVQRGHDVTEYTLSCFGGAAGQHACLVADALGMQTVFMHPLAGVLSAYGIGLADVTVMKQRAVESVLDDRTLADLATPFAVLVSEARDALLAQGVSSADISIERRVALKYEGTDSTLQLAVAADAATLTAAFLEQYRVRYGFLMPNTEVGDRVDLGGGGGDDQRWNGRL